MFFFTLAETGETGKTAADHDPGAVDE